MKFFLASLLGIVVVGAGVYGWFVWSASSTALPGYIVVHPDVVVDSKLIATVQAYDQVRAREGASLTYPPSGDTKEEGPFILVLVANGALWFAQGDRAESSGAPLSRPYGYSLYRVPFTEEAGKSKIVPPGNSLGYLIFGRASMSASPVEMNLMREKAFELSNKEQ